MSSVLLARSLRALWIFGLIFLTYLSQYALTQLLGSWERDSRGRDYLRVPKWVHRRWDRLHSANSDRLYEGIVRLRGVYIKLGQVLSITGAFLPRIYQKRLERLQDQVPPRPFSEIRDALEASLGKSIAECYAKIDETALAAASLGQVHVAWLHAREGESEGRKVAVKVLYPGIRDIIVVDMRIVWLALQVYRRFVPVHRIERVHASLVDLLARETDYVNEARCMEKMARNFAAEKDILFPEVEHALSSSDVLTMTFMEGTKINKIEELRARNIDTAALAIRFVEIFYKMVFIDRLFHADPHPGNFLVQPGRTPRRPKIVILDFGAISSVRDELIEGGVDIIGGLLAEDGDRLLSGFYAMGFVSKGANRELLEKTVRSYFKKLVSIKDRSPSALMKARPEELERLANPDVAREELQELMKSVEYPEDWFYLERAAVMAFWLVGQIDPDIDTMRIGYPYIMPLLMKRGEVGEFPLLHGGGE